jgi:hypothetical protein
MAITGTKAVDTGNTMFCLTDEIHVSILEARIEIKYTTSRQ